MRETTMVRIGALLVATLVVVAGLAGCGQAPVTPTKDQMSTDTVTTEASGERPTENQDPSAPVTEGGGDYAFGAERQDMATAIEAAFATRNATARWKGEVLILSLDGDADEDMAAFSECRILVQLLKEDDGAMVEFPNGKLDCAEVLTED